MICFVDRTYMFSYIKHRVDFKGVLSVMKTAKDVESLRNKKVKKAKKSDVKSDVLLHSNREENDKEKAARLAKQAEEEKKKEEQRKKSPYRNFLQVNKDAYKQEDWLMKESPAAYRLLRFIAQNMDNYNALICSYTVFSESLGYGRTTLSNAVKLLKDNNYLKIVKSGSANIYIINNELYWQSYGSNFSRCEFNAKIVISSEEQDEQDKAEIKAKRYKMLAIEDKSNADEENNEAS